ncbi:MAG: hypothetical protein KDJ37_16755 [Hyphomicrobiaceae bacterium]|nr:hypothetical protein [Hyphomicrobiaceae bacterium]
MRGPKSSFSRQRVEDDDSELHEAREVAEWLAPDAGRTFYPGEPIYWPRRRRGIGKVRAMFASLVIAASGYGLWQTQAHWRPWASERLAAVMAGIEASRAASAALPSPVPVPPSPEAQGGVPQMDPPPKDVAEAPGAASGEAVAAIAPPADTAATTDATAESQPSAANSEAEPSATEGARSETLPAPLPPPVVDSADPYQKRALAAGLHPELSRALLSRLTEEDYRNARAAIAKAIADVADGEAFLWPKKRAPKLALFQVHFVQGAAADCRRYVVTVTKDGWATTALPMERCGVKAPRHASAG